MTGSSGEDSIGLDDLRQSALSAAAAGCLAAATALLLTNPRPGLAEDWVPAYILALYLLAGLTYLGARMSVATGGLALGGGVLILTTAALWFDPLAWTVYLMPLLVIFAGAFGASTAGLAVAVVVTADLLFVRLIGGPVSGEVLRTVLALTWAGVVAAWLSSQPMRRALKWSWANYVQAEREAEQARRQRGELAQLVKSLNIAQDRLEQANVELERARRAAERARRQKTEFAAMISHELRTPLNLIVGFSEMIASNPNAWAGQPLSPACQLDVDTIYRNALHLSGLIDDVLDLAQIDAARLGLVRERVDLAVPVRGAVSAVEPLFRQKRLDLVVDLPEYLPPVDADRVRVGQVLINLLSNAARSTEVGGVRVSARVQDRDALVTVADTGVGIAPEDLPRIFDEFRQAVAPGARRGGSGLGLTICKRLVELHGGSIWAESRPGEGSTFLLTLPLFDNVASSPLRHEWETWARPARQRDGPEGVIAVCDDDAESARLLQRYLDGCRVVPVESIAAARKLRASAPLRALVLTGSSWPEVWQQANQARVQIGDRPVFACHLWGRRDLARELGVVDYLVKPVLREQLARVLRQRGRLPRDVLVIDDDPEMVNLLERLTHSIARRAKVRGVYSGADGLAALRERRPDLVLLDLLMPDLDGYAVLQAIRADEALRGIPVVLVTARGKDEETRTSEMLSITRAGGLTVGELVRVLRVSLDALDGQSAGSSYSGPGQPGASLA
ncbi:MAG: response regulator [Chloroflexi bacterium]|nr:response regulator [Chloroflexota bacterium]